ncbi:hypothetical protein DERF_003280 [Dermatophagoides farinae]|uniref:Uncharacterized protein n=1 Tax=Dermatophagoides farinae TaxID=6954 RepID=A0A922IEF6_DERFA|nr:hypothetical protein DERF_003280 [Dermatophagoides farinae]
MTKYDRNNIKYYKKANTWEACCWCKRQTKEGSTTFTLHKRRINPDVQQVKVVVILEFSHFVFVSFTIKYQKIVNCEYIEKENTTMKIG